MWRQDQASEHDETDPGRRARDVMALQRLATGNDAVRSVVRWLARRTGMSIVVYDTSGRRHHAVSPLPVDDLLGHVRSELDRVTAGQAAVIPARVGRYAVRIVAIGDRVPRPVLVVIGTGGSADTDVIGDAADILALCWRVEEAGRRERSTALADVRVREAVLHLLMVGNVSAARRVAGALRPSLADTVRVHIVGCPPAIRGEMAARCDATWQGQAWIVRCPVYSGHLIVLAPAEQKKRDHHKRGSPVDEEIKSLVAETPRCHVGSSEIVALHDVASGYEQAFHSLTTSIATGGRPATAPAPNADLVGTLGESARAPAIRLLTPLLDFRPGRRQDPNAEELMATLRAWLYFQSGAARQLKLHRNTLAARLRLIETLLKTDLGDLAVQARLQLALRVVHGAPMHRSDEAVAPSRDAAESEMDGLLDSEAVRRWAEREIQPLRGPGSGSALRTLRIWLASNARLAPTAAALGVSVAGVRKRLVRLEGTLGRSLLAAPSARYDLWFALRAIDVSPDQQRHPPAQRQPGAR